MNKQEVDNFISLSSRIESLHQELGILSKKSPNDALNKFKLNVVNSILQEANDLLAEKPPLKGFGQFSEDDLPTNSDVVFILGLYRKALEKIRSDNIVLDYSEKFWYWEIDGRQSSTRTNPPIVM